MLQGAGAAFNRLAGPGAGPGTVNGVVIARIRNAVGLADFVSDGQYTVTLTADTTKSLAAGANRLEIAVVPLAVAVPTFADANFVTAP